MFKNQPVKNVLSAVAVAVFGLILLNVTFLFDFFVQTLIDSVVKLFAQTDINRVWRWYPPLKHFIFVAIVILISRFIFKSKLKTIFKVIYFVVPLAIIYVTIGIFLYRLPLLAFLLSSYFFLGFLYFFKRTKQPWLYYYALILVSLTLLIFNLLGEQI